MRFLSACWLVIGLLFMQVCMANVVITGTRIIYPAQQKEIGIELTNTRATPSLVQAWISHDVDGDDDKDTPFVLTPPIFRIDGDKKQTLRVIYTHEPLPTDKETLFYFNLLDIPPMPSDEEADQNYLQLSLLSKLKFFYRPKNLKPSIDKAYGQLGVRATSGGVIIDNPTPYFMTVSAVSVFAHKDDTTAIDETTNTPMIAPFGQAHVQINTANAHFAKLEIINDYGGRMYMPAIAIK